MEEALKTLGLTAQERNIYQACLKLESAKASTIAEHASIERQASYYILRLLLKKGLITESTKSGVAYYAPVHPKLILERIEDERKMKENAVKHLITEYENLKGTALLRPKVEMYEGLEGFKTAAREMISGEDKLAYSIISEKVINFKPLDIESYVTKRVARGIKAHVLTEETPSTKEHKKGDKKILREIRFLDSIIKGKDYELGIAQDKVIFLKVTDKEQIGIKIEDPSFAELQRNIFKLLWNQAKR